MPLRRVVALAQALTMILLLVPGPHPAGPALVRAAPAPAESPAVNVFDATGNGIGCRAGTRKFKGPGLAKDPPWPPGSKPTPRPEPTPEPSPGSTQEPPADATADPAASDEPAGEATTAVLAADAEVQFEFTQAEPAPRRRNQLLTGIDVSHHQGQMDWDRVRKAGHRFAIIKATENNGFIDSMFPTNLARARAVGLATGAYHVFDYTLDGRAQANHFVDRLERVGGLDGSLPPVVDVECFPYYGPSLHAAAATRLRDFVARVYERTARMPMIYTSVYMWRQVMGDAEGFDDQPLWAACWDCANPPSLAAGWNDWLFWQIGAFRIPGVTLDNRISDKVDGNYFRGRGQDLKALQLRPFSIADGAAATGGGDVPLDLGGRDATHIRTSPDGEDWTTWSRIRSTPTASIPSTEGQHTIHVQLRNGPGLRSPVFSDSIFVDATPPEVSLPTVALREGLLEGPARVPIVVSWEARDASAGLSDASVLVACGQDRNARSEAPGSAEPGETATWEAAASLFADASCEVNAIAQDGAGNRQRMTSDPVQTTLVAIATDEPATATVSGSQVGVIARRGPDAGRASVSIDGTAVGLVDLYAPAVGEPEVVYVAALDGADQQVSVEATGTADPASTGTSVVIDAFVTLGS